METGLLVLNKQSERFALACLDVSDLSQMSTYTIEKIRISGCLILSKSTLSRRRIPILPKNKGSCNGYNSTMFASFLCRWKAWLTCPEIKDLHFIERV